MTQFWLTAGPKSGCSTLIPPGAGPGPAVELPATIWLSRLRYIQPPTSPEVKISGNVPELVGVEEVSGSVMAAGTDGEMTTVVAKVVGFSCSSKRTISEMGIVA